MPRHLTTNDSASFIAATELGVANGVAQLDNTGKLALSQLPPAASAPVTSVNGKLGNVVLNSTDVGAVAASAVGGANGVAPLDSSGLLPASKLPAGAVTSVNGYAGPTVTLAASDVGALTQTAADGRYPLLTQVGAASGLASLDSGGKVPVGQIPNLSASYLTVAEQGAANGVAALDGGGKLSLASFPTSVLTPDGLALRGGPELVIAASNSRSTRGADYICTGTNDNTVIQTAINAVAAASGKGTVRLLDGTFSLGATLSIPNGIGLNIVGSGWGTVLKVANGANIYAMTFAGPNDTRARFANFTIDGNCLNQTTGGGGIYAPGAVWCIFENLHFTSCWDVSLYLGPQPVSNAFGHNNVVDHCLFDQTTGSTGQGQAIYCTSNDENFIQSCDFEYLGGSTGTAAAILDKAGTQQIIGCNFVNGGHNAYGIRVQDAAANTKIVGCNFDGLAGDCIFIAASNAVIHSNTFFEIGIAGTAGAASGIHLEYAAQGASVMGNTLSSSATNGQTRSLIREENVGGSGNNNIQCNTLITKGTLSVGLMDLNAPGTLVRNNYGVTDNLLTTAMKGVANGVATLDGTGKLPSSQLPAGTGFSLDTTATDIQPLGTRAAGSVGQAADAGHVHAMPTLDQIGAAAANVGLNSKKITSLANGTAASDAAAFGQIPTALPPNGTASGDLSGTYPGPTVAKVNGITVTGTPSTGQVLTATSTTAANWQAASGGVALAGDLGNTTASPQVISTHLAAPLPVAQGGTGSATAAAARTALSVVALDSQVINVKDHGVLGDGSTDDYAALNTIISTAAAGSTIYFPKGTYIVGTLLTLYSDLTYVGSNVDNTIIKAKNASNLAALAATVGWAGSTATSSVDPLHIRNLTFDGNKTNQTSGTGHGVVLQTYYSTLHNVNVQNTRGDGLRFDAYGANGSSAISNTMVENHVQRVQLRNCGGSGFVVNDSSHNKATDGWLIDCIVDTPGANAIWLGAGAGWTIDRCHTYNVPQSAIRVDRAFETRIVNNYIESCGSSATLGTYALIDCINFGAQDNGQGSSISNNTIYYQGPAGNGSSTIAGIAFQSASGGSANVSITGNQIFCTGQTGLPAIWLQNQSGTASLTAQVSGNNLVGWGTNVSTVANGGTLTVSGDNAPSALKNLPDTNFFVPSDHGLIAWTMDPSCTGANGTSLSGGFVYLMMINLKTATTISKIEVIVGTAGSGLTASQCFAGLYSTAGTRLALTADMSTTWNSVGDKKMSLTSSYSAAAGKYYVALLVNGTTSPTFACGSTYGATFTPGNANLAAGGYRWCRGSSGSTSLPTSITVSGYTPDANNIYAAVL